MNKFKTVLLFSFVVIASCVALSAFAQTEGDNQPQVQQKTVRDLQSNLQKLQTVQNPDDTPTTALNAAPTTSSAIPERHSDLAPPTEDENQNKDQRQQVNPVGGNQNTNQAQQKKNVQQAPDPYESAFNGVVNQLIPMTPEQIRRLRAAFDASKRAAAAPVGTPPKPTSSSIQVNLSPQATPPIIRLEGGYISSLVFMDATGQAWPIASYSIGNPSAFNIQWDKKGNTLLIQATSYYKRTNLAIMLKGLDTPVMLTLLPGQGAVDYRVDLHIPKLGPNAAFMPGAALPGSANPILLDVLNGIPPHGSKTLTVKGSNDAQAWLSGNNMYLRTHLNVISPAWHSVMSSMDGTHAYELPPSPVVLAVEHGKDQTITLQLTGWE